MIELRILSGSRAGQTESFEKSVIAIGRHPMSDLHFDATQDLDVSARHGEIRGLDGRYTIADNQSTNGTFVNGEAIPRGGTRELRDGDVIAFGAHGPTVSVRIADSKTTPIGERVTAAIPTPPVGVAAVGTPSGSGPRRPTSERVAIAVAEQTRGLKIAMAAGVVVLAGLGGGLYWMGHREAAASDAKLQSMMSAYEESSKQLQSRVAPTNDTTLIHNLERERDSLVRAVRDAKSDEASAVVQQAIQKHQDATRALGEMDMQSVVAANNAAIAFIRSDIGDEAFEATGFGVGANGLVVTNRHVVETSKGKASRVMVKFADTPTFHRARVVRVAGDSSDLALLQLDDAGKFPVVKGVAPSVDVAVGGAIASIGFPLGSELPMEGSRATTTLTLGTVSKTTSELLQIDSYASHGSSGSPVFDGHGHVIGVIYGGPKEAAGRIVYAVPSAAVAALLKGR